LTVKILSADFAAASKNSRKKSVLPSKTDTTSVMDANENVHASRRYTAVVCFADEIYDDMPLQVLSRVGTGSK